MGWIRRRAVPWLVLTCLGSAASVAPAQELALFADSEPAAATAPAPQDQGDWIEVVWPGEDDPPSGDFLRVGGLLSLELIDWGSANDKDDGLHTEALSLLLSGRAGDATFFVDLDADGEETRHNLREGWMDGPLAEQHWIRAGWLRFALGSEFATREEDLPFPGYAFPSWENGRYGPGVAVDGYPAPWLWWQAGATAGHDANLAGDSLGEPQYSLRVLALPGPGPDGAFEGWFGGVAMARTTDLDGPLHVETPLDQTVFTTADLEGDSRSVLAFEVGYRAGGFRFGVENCDGELREVELPGGGDQSFDQVGAWSAYLTWNLNGPAPVWSRGRWLPYDLEEGDELPLEIGLRYSNADIDRDLFDAGLASFDPSIQEVRSVTVAVSAWLHRLTKVSAAYVGIVGDQETTRFGDHDSDQSVLLRLDQRF